jgi:phage-related protein
MSTGEEEETPKPVFFLGGEIKTPPFSDAARHESGQLLRRLQEGESIGMPSSRPMPSIGPACHELRVRDDRHNWRIIYRIEEDLILIIDVFAKTTQATPDRVIRRCKKRLKDHDAR